MRHILLLMMLAFATLGLALPQNAIAECNEICRKKCEATSKDVPACIKRWTEINKNPARAKALESAMNKARTSGCWTAANCALRCRAENSSQGEVQVKSCIANHPCSKYPKSC